MWKLPVSPRRDTSLSSEALTAVLALPLTGVLTTLGRDGWPHSTAMWFVFVDDEIRMWTYAKSQKTRNVQRDARTAFLIEDGSAYSELRGVLVQGRARLITTFADIADIGKRLYDRYTAPQTGLPLERVILEEIERQAGKRVGLAIPLERVSSWDHSKL